MSASDTCRLLLFLRYPQVGRTKTRLIPALGAAGAAELQRQMAEYLLRRLQHRNWQLQVHFTGASLAQMRECFGSELTYRPQLGLGLGDRIQSGFQQSFQEGQKQGALPTDNKVIAIGADCPDLSVHHVQLAFDELQHHDSVVGPASDGGYYLIGLRQSAAGLSPTKSLAPISLPISLAPIFEGIDWSTPLVFEQTMAKIHQLGLSVATLETLSDVDRPEDLILWERLQVLAT